MSIFYNNNDYIDTHIKVLMDIKPKIYFGHPINLYNTLLERELIEAIRTHFPEWDIENPNQSHHFQGYNRRKNEGGRGMDYFFEEVLPQMDGGIFLAFEDGKFGAGVFGEAGWLRDHQHPIFEIGRDKKIGELELDDSRKLSIDETRTRVYGTKK
jgi:hypothetical protein